MNFFLARWCWFLGFGIDTLVVFDKGLFEIQQGFPFRDGCLIRSWRGCEHNHLAVGQWFGTHGFKRLATTDYDILALSSRHLFKILHIGRTVPRNRIVSTDAPLAVHGEDACEKWVLCYACHRLLY